MKSVWDGLLKRSRALSNSPSQRSQQSQCVWAVEVKYTTSTSWECPRTWSGMQPVSSVQSATSIWMRRALVLFGMEKPTVKGIMQGKEKRKKISILIFFYLGKT